MNHPDAVAASARDFLLLLKKLQLPYMKPEYFDRKFLTNFLAYDPDLTKTFSEPSRE
jgi:hypothetical protein